MKARRYHILSAMILLVLLAAMAACSSASPATDAPLETLVLQTDDLPEDVEFRAQEALSVDNPAHPLANFPDVDLENITETYHVFALHPDPVFPILNYAMRFDTLNAAARTQATIIAYLQELPEATTVEQGVSDHEIFTALSPGGEGTRVYWSAVAQNDILILLVMEALDDPGIAPAAEEFFLDGLRALEARISG